MYNPNYYQPYYQQTQYPQYNQQIQAQPAQQVQNSGFVSVRGEMEARNYAVAPGNSITFIDETAPYCYTKTMGFSQLDRPRFEKYRLVKEEEQSFQAESAKEEVPYALKSDLSAFSADLRDLRDKVDNLLKGKENGSEQL